MRPTEISGVRRVSVLRAISPVRVDLLAETLPENSAAQLRYFITALSFCV